MKTNLNTDTDACTRTRIKRAAATLSALGASKGGLARAAGLSAKRRSAIARKAARARWDGAEKRKT